jgi:hypothetical protein
MFSKGRVNKDLMIGFNSQLPLSPLPFVTLRGGRLR